MLARTQLLLACLLMSCQSNSSASSETAARPSQAGTGQVVAWVHLVDGSATVQAANGFSFEARPGVSLLRTDRVRAGEAAFVVLRLANRYLVRIDQQVTLAVSDIYLLDAPRASADYQQQIDQLLTRKERARGERIAGWQARLTGAQTVAPLAVKHKRKKKEVARSLQEMKTTAEEEAPHMSVGKTGQAPPPGYGGESAKDTERRAKRPSRRKSLGKREAPEEEASAYRGAPPDEDKEEEYGESPADVAGGAVPEGRALAKVKVPEPVWFIRTGQTERRPKRPVPALVYRVANDPALRSCLQQAVAGLPIRVDRVRLLLRVHNLRVQQVSLGGGLATPVCAGEGVLYKPIPEIKEDCWVIVEVPIR